MESHHKLQFNTLNPLKFLRRNNEAMHAMVDECTIEVRLEKEGCDREAGCCDGKHKVCLCISKITGPKYCRICVPATTLYHPWHIVYQSQTLNARNEATSDCQLPPS